MTYAAKTEGVSALRLFSAAQAESDGDHASHVARYGTPSAAKGENQ